MRAQAGAQYSETGGGVSNPLPHRSPVVLNRIDTRSRRHPHPGPGTATG
ncbi:hypothetical protein SAMN04488591_2981 [Microbacterium azadirachtae]|uniref:Uncharacterized protein n=1 Tax=Microbacterium azadirachtae TaxID=582680 RepID=A0A1I6IQV6_9MICO|nr:hypothetical protein SAMN04488591_2981 [Microbacterium azadirachtae]